jgi:3-oxoacyl-[acyl-carrier protein] reductase
MDLNDKVAVVTGANGGIGALISHRIAEAGARVVVGYNSKAAEAAKIAASLPGQGISRCASPCWKPM